MDRQLFSALSSIPLFSSLAPARLEALLEQPGCVTKTYGDGQIIHLKGDRCTSLDCLAWGSVALLHLDGEGSCMQVETLDRPAAFGAPLLFSSRNVFPLTVASGGASAVVHIPRRLVLSLCEESREYTRSLLRLVSDRALFLTDTIGAIQFKTIRQRLMEYLKGEALRQGSNRIVLPCSKQELAQRLGVQRSSLGRELGKMRAEGLVSFDRRSVTLL